MIISCIIQVFLLKDKLLNNLKEKNEWKRLETEGDLYSTRKYASAVAWKSNVVIWGGRTPEEGLSEVFLLDLSKKGELLFC